MFQNLIMLLLFLTIFLMISNRQQYLYKRFRHSITPFYFCHCLSSNYKFQFSCFSFSFKLSIPPFQLSTGCCPKINVNILFIKYWYSDILLLVLRIKSVSRSLRNWLSYLRAFTCAPMMTHFSHALYIFSEISGHIW